MGDYLRDKKLIKKTITEDSLNALVEVLEDQESKLNSTNAKGYCFISFVIRYDGKGYKIFVLSDLLKHYKKAKNIERIYLKLDIAGDIPNAMRDGEAIEVWLSNINNETSYIKVEGDDLDWVNLTFTALDEIFDQCKSRHSWIRGGWVPLAIQLSGVMVIFTLCLLLSRSASEHLIFENPGLFAFIFFFLVFSNIWTYLNPLIMRLLENIFPNIYFNRKDKQDINTLLMGSVTAGLLGLLWFVLSVLSANLGPFLLSFWK